MPSRKNYKTIPTPEEIQGEGAWVKIKEITVNEAEEYQNLTVEMDKKFNPRRQELFKAFADENKLSVDELDDTQKTMAVMGSELIEESKKFFYDYYSKYVIEWNWVKDEVGNPMEQPFNNPVVFGSLTAQEFNYIQDLFRAKESDEKK